MITELDSDEEEAFLTLAERLRFLTKPVAESLRTAVNRSREVDSSPAKSRDLAARQGHLTAAQIDIIEMLLRPHAAIPGYELQDYLGHGGMGVVFKARQLNLDRIVALKTILVSGLGQSDALLRFEREARAVARLQHPNIVAAYDFGQHEGRLFLAMEFLKGTDVDKWVDTEGPLPETVVWSLARQAVAGLAHAAHAGIIHRDIKPANMLLVDPPEGSNLPPGIPLLKLADFGLARLGGDLESSSRLTRQNTTVGSPHYMAPEQLQGGAVDSRADLYALGASLYHMLTGRPPFDLGNLAHIISQKISSGPNSLRDVAPGFHPTTYRLVESLMELTPEQRPSETGQLLRQIDELLDELPSLAVNQGLWSHSAQILRGERETVDQTFVFSRVNPTSATAAASNWRPSATNDQNSTRAGQVAMAMPAQPADRTHRRPRQRFMLLGTVGLLGVVILAGYVWLGPSELPQLVRREMSEEGYHSRLFNGTDLVGWNRRSGAWSSPPGTAKLEGTNGVIEKLLLLRPDAATEQPVRIENYRLQFFVDQGSATAVELHFGLAAESARDGLRWVLQLTPGHFQVGECASDSAAFVPRESPVPNLPASDHPTVVILEQQPGGWFLKINDAAEIALPRREQELSEFRFRVAGGPAAFSDIELTRLRTDDAPRP